jgi:hypothetical protein
MRIMEIINTRDSATMHRGQWPPLLEQVAASVGVLKLRVISVRLVVKRNGYQLVFP